jgi:hypothetical protein
LAPWPLLNDALSHKVANRGKSPRLPWSLSPCWGPDSRLSIQVAQTWDSQRTDVITSVNTSHLSYGSIATQQPRTLGKELTALRSCAGSCTGSWATRARQSGTTQAAAVCHHDAPIVRTLRYELQPTSTRIGVMNDLHRSLASDWSLDAAAG